MKMANAEEEGNLNLSCEIIKVMQHMENINGKK